MNPRTALSIREISRRIDVPESTLRYYRKLFSAFIPTVGSGRRRRHPEAALGVFERISEAFAAGESREAIAHRLASMSAGAVGSGGAGDTVLSVDVARPVTEVTESSSLRARDMERLVTAMMVRDRELTTMHRELIDLVGQLIRALSSIAGVKVEEVVAGAPEVATGARPMDESAKGRPPPKDSPDVERLREMLARERETIERMRRARVDLEQRLARLEREHGERERRRR